MFIVFMFIFEHLDSVPFTRTPTAPSSSAHLQRNICHKYPSSNARIGSARFSSHSFVCCVVVIRSSLSHKYKPKKIHKNGGKKCFFSLLFFWQQCLVMPVKLHAAFLDFLCVCVCVCESGRRAARLIWSNTEKSSPEPQQ